jgi:hypothetical protein
MEVANTLAYYDKATITAVKSFIVQAPGYYVSVRMKTVLNRLAYFGQWINLRNRPHV